MRVANGLALTIPGLVLVAVLFAAWPGYLSFDAGFQFWQARSHRYLDVAPPLFPWIWHHSLRVFDSTHGMLVLFAALFVAALSLLVHATEGARRKWLVAIAAPSCPLLVLMLPHLWTDVLLAACLLLAFALIDSIPGRGSVRLTAARRVLYDVPILLLLLASVSVRHNGALAVWPLVVLWLWRISPEQSRLTRAWASGLALMALVGAGTVFRLGVVERPLDTWAVGMLFDLQAVSIDTRTQRIPQHLVGPGMDVAQLQEAFDPYSATRLFAGTRSGVANPTVVPLTAAQASGLRKAWFALWLEPSFWAHRWRLFSALLGTHRSDALRPLADSPHVVQYRDNPPLIPSHPLAHQRYRALIDAAFRTPVFSVGLILLLGTAAFVRRWRSGMFRELVPAAALLFSASLYTLPFLLIAPSAELRYLLWPGLAGWLVMLGVGCRPVR
jgi:hypothetical protein